MGRIFRRGELREVVLVVLDNLGQTHAYAVLSELDSKIDAWTPSPGAIYPALLGLVDAGLVETTEQGNTRLYTTTAAGRDRAALARKETRWPGLNERARDQTQAVTLGVLLDRLADGFPSRSKVVSGNRLKAIEQLLQQLSTELDAITNTTKE